MSRRANESRHERHCIEGLEKSSAGLSLRPNSVSPPATEQRLLRGLRRQGHDVIRQLHMALAATHEANVAEVVASISLKRLDFRFIVRGYRSVPVQPKLPAIRHGVGQLNVNDVCPFPVPAPPGRRMQAPEFLGPPFAKML